MFRPLHDRHAIREAAFAITTKSPIEPALVEAVGSNLQVPWRDHAPKRTDVHAMLLNVQQAPAPQSFANLLPNGLQYEGFGKSGERVWRVTIEPLSIAVNCLDYPGWETAWPMILSWLRWIAQQPGAAAIEAGAFALQYINAFLWEGDPQDCNPSALLRPGSRGVAPFLYDYRDSRWHHHVGRFQAGGVPIRGEMLVRTHLTGNRLSEPTGVRFEALVDVLIQAQQAAGLRLSGALEPDGPVDQLYAELHHLVKDELSMYLTDQLIESIHLHA